MTSAKATARLAGALYLVSGIPGMFSYLYVPATLIVPGSAAQTAQRIASAPIAYRMAIVSDVASQALLILLGLTLYELLKDVDRRYARVMVMFAAAGAVIELSNPLHLIGPLLLYGADWSLAFSKPQVDALALTFLQARGTGLFVAQVFWGLWLFPFGVLVIRSASFPRILGQLLIVACFGYVAASAAFFLIPAHAHSVIQLGQLLGGLGEGAMLLWLLIKGVEAPTPEVRVSIA